MVEDNAVTAIGGIGIVLVLGAALSNADISWPTLHVQERNPPGPQPICLQGHVERWQKQFIYVCTTWKSNLEDTPSPKDQPQ